MRLTQKVPRHKMIDMLSSYGIGPEQASGTTNNLALLLAQQLHYETDDGDDEDEDSDEPAQTGRQSSLSRCLQHHVR